MNNQIYKHAMCNQELRVSDRKQSPIEMHKTQLPFWYQVEEVISSHKLLSLVESEKDLYSQEFRF